MKKRCEIEEKYKWDLTEYFKSDDAWQNEFEMIKPLYSRLAGFEGKLVSDASLLECLNLQKEVGERVGRLYVYISLKVKEDGKNDFYQNRINKLNKYLSDVSPSLAYIASEINEFTDEKLNRLIKDSKFSEFDLVFKDALKSKPHMLSKVEEKLLSKVSECIGGSSNVFDMLDAVDITFEDVTDSNGNKLPLNNANYSSYILSTDRSLRETAFKNLNGGYGKFNYTIATNYMNNVITDCTLAKVRKFENAFSQALFEEDVRPEVYTSLTCGVNANLESFHRYFKLKQKALGLPNFYNYDVNAKLAVKNNKNFTYEEAFNVVTDALKVLGNDYTDMLNIAKDSRWIDVMPNENKDTGAFAWGSYGAHPVVLLNFEGSINSVFTLAHELGHMMHTYYSDKNLPSTKAGYEIFVAEVASTVNEMILAKTLLNKAGSKEEKLYYIDYLMNMFYSTVYRQTMFAEFEYNSHKAYEDGEETSTEALNNMYMELAKKYFGKDVILADELKYEWSRIPHFYNSFYVYKYATGLISALAISNKILANEKDAVKNYKQFLSSGCKKSPVELLKIAGVDLTDKSTFDNAFNFIKEILDEWEKEIN